MAVHLRSGRIESLTCGDGSQTHDGTQAVCTIFGRSVSALPDFSEFLGFLDFFVLFPD